MKKNKKLPGPLIFNLGRIWQAATSDDWSEAERVCDLIEETGFDSARLKRVRKAILKEDTDRVDKQLSKILGW